MCSGGACTPVNHWFACLKEPFLRIGKCINALTVYASMHNLVLYRLRTLEARHDKRATTVAGPADLARRHARSGQRGVRGNVAC
ncbi:hypothetical protein D3C73_1550750 [compost metagenome]